MSAPRQPHDLMQTAIYLGDYKLEDEAGERVWDAQEKSERRHDEICDQLKSGDMSSVKMFRELEDSNVLCELLAWASRGYTDLNETSIRKMIERAVKLGADEILAKEEAA
ncbi:hypothetical protein [Allohahella sp. A8]|uniref:hypothetical protein n=1 Tax=Allohahella sp. A8 TaxID=3141461 RepID=UPI003A80C873